MTRPKVHQYTQTYGKLGVSPQSLARLRVMHLFDLAMKFDDFPANLPEMLLSGTVNPDWLKRWDVFRSPEFHDTMLSQLKREGDTASWGCFRVRRAERTFIVTSTVARIPIGKVKLRRRVIRFVGAGKNPWSKVVKDVEVTERDG